MDRRRFLQTLAASTLAGTVTGKPLLAAESWKSQFHAALKSNPWLLGYQTVRQPVFSETNLEIEGSLPADLTGTFFRNGPAQHEVGELRYHHWFDGDGMMHAYRFDGHRVTHRAKIIETDKYLREKEAGRALVHGFGTATAELERPTSADGLNVANISVLKHGGELLALWEGGSAHRLDEETLDTLGLKTWSDQTAGAPFSAHPRVDADGTLWNFGYAATVGAIVLYKISPSGSVQDIGLISAPDTPMVHDFVITEKHLVLILAPYRFDASREGAFLDKYVWRSQEAGRALVIDKNDLTAVREIEVPPMWIFHYANAYEDSSGRITMHAPVYDTPAVMTETFREVMRGKDVDAAGSTFNSLTLDPMKGSFSVQEISGLENSEFPRIDMKLQGQRQRYSYAMQSSRARIGQGFNRVNRIDHETGKIQSYQYSDSEMAEEHIYVARSESSKEGDGWLLGTSLDFVKQQSMLNVLRADALEDGPVARMTLPYALPLGLHGNFYS